MTYNTFTATRTYHEMQLQQARQILATVEADTEMPVERKQIWIEWHKAEEAAAMDRLNELCVEYYGKGYEYCYWN